MNRQGGHVCIVNVALFSRFVYSVFPRSSDNCIRQQLKWNALHMKALCHQVLYITLCLHNGIIALQSHMSAVGANKRKPHFFSQLTESSLPMRMKRRCIGLSICTPSIKKQYSHVNSRILRCARPVPTRHAPSNGLIERSKPPDRIETGSGLCQQMHCAQIAL